MNDFIAGGVVLGIIWLCCVGISSCNRNNTLIYQEQGKLVSINLDEGLPCHTAGFTIALSNSEGGLSSQGKIPQEEIKQLQPFLGKQIEVIYSDTTGFCGTGHIISVKKSKEE